MGICGSFDEDEEEGFMKVAVLGLPGSGKTALVHRLAWQATPKWILQNQKPTKGADLVAWRNDPYPGLPNGTNLVFHELAGTSLLSAKGKNAVCDECDLFIWCIDGTMTMCKFVLSSWVWTGKRTWEEEGRGQKAGGRGRAEGETEWEQIGCVASLYHSPVLRSA